MQLIVATNWDFKLIDELAKYPVKDIWGAAKSQIGGHARPSFVLNEISEEQIAEYVKKVHEKKMTFTYLLNAPCMNNMEYVPEFHRKLIDFIQWISDIGSDSIVVTIPFLMQIIKEQFPNLKIRVSTIAHVDSVAKAKHFEMLGASEISPSIMINRDFKLLKRMQKAVKCKIIPLVTDGCLYQCPHRLYHYNIVGHSSQINHPIGANYIDSCILNCSVVKYSTPAEILKCRFIRPEDLNHYEEIGIDTFKIAGRRMTTDWILRNVKAYSSRKYRGNLVDIIQGFSFSVGVENDPNARLTETVYKEPTTKLYIDNTKLDGFIDFFKKQDCISMCDGKCNYCEEWAKKAVKLDKVEAPRYVESLEDYIDDLITGREFGVPNAKPKEKKKRAFNWDPESERIFDEMMKTTPSQARPIATISIASLAEEKARNRDSQIVEHQDMVAALIEGTPGPFQSDMEENIKRLGLEKEFLIQKELIEKARERAQEEDSLKEASNKDIKDNLETKEEWEEYLTRFMNVFKDLAEVPPIINPVAPFIFQYKITDKTEMSWWLLMEKNSVSWGMGEYSGDNFPIVVHKTDFDTMKKVNSGELNPIEATMARKYFIEGDTTILMACAPLAPLNGKVHAIISEE